MFNLKPTHRKLMVIGASRDEVLERVTEIQRQYPVDDPVVVVCTGAEFICNLYIIFDEAPVMVEAHAMEVKL